MQRVSVLFAEHEEKSARTGLGRQDGHGGRPTASYRPPPRLQVAVFLAMTPPGVGYAVKRGEVIAGETGYVLWSYLRSPKPSLTCLGAFFHDSNSVLGNPDWRMMDCSVPVRNSAWFGTGTVMVVS